MTDEELIQYYADLLVVQYRDKPNAVDTIKAFIKQVVMNKLAINVLDAYDIESAVGDQLDTLGKYAGISRDVRDFSGPVSLNNDDYRSLIKVAIIKNTFGSSLYEIQNLLNDFFPGTLFVFDYLGMRMSYFFDSDEGSRQLAEVFVREDFLPKPMGVQLGTLIYNDSIDDFFGFRRYGVEASNASPFNTYDDYIETWPWLSDAYAIWEQDPLLINDGSPLLQENDEELYL